MRPPNPSEHEMHAFIDDELAPSRRDEIAEILHEDGDLAARVTAFKSDRELLRKALDDIADEPLPASWAALIEAGMRPRPRMVPRVVTSRRFAVAASVALVVSLAGGSRWQWSEPETILAEAEAASDGRLRGQVAAADPLPPPASRDALLLSKLGMHVRAPDLVRFGFHLTRMELFDRKSGGAAQLRYVDAAQRNLTIFVRASDGTVRFDIIHRADTYVCIWQDDVVGAVITAQVSAPEMLRIASSAYTSLNF
jgi:anti-sigma factor RsiW